MSVIMKAYRAFLVWRCKRLIGRLEALWEDVDRRSDLRLTLSEVFCVTKMNKQIEQLYARLGLE